MDISFTSDEEDDDNASVKAKINTSDLYYDTNKSGKGKKDCLLCAHLRFLPEDRQHHTQYQTLHTSGKPANTKEGDNTRKRGVSQPARNPSTTFSHWSTIVMCPGADVEWADTIWNSWWLRTRQRRMKGTSMTTSDRKNTFLGNVRTDYFRWARFLYRTTITRAEWPLNLQRKQPQLLTEAKIIKRIETPRIGRSHAQPLITRDLSMLGWTMQRPTTTPTGRI